MGKYHVTTAREEVGWDMENGRPTLAEIILAAKKEFSDVPPEELEVVCEGYGFDVPILILRRKEK